MHSNFPDPPTRSDPYHDFQVDASHCLCQDSKNHKQNVRKEAVNQYPRKFLHGKLYQLLFANENPSQISALY